MLALKKASPNDCELYFDWANDKSVRKNAFHANPIVWQEHQKWFNNKLKSNNSYLYIIEFDKNKIGQVRFDCENGVAVIDYSISSICRGKGFGKEAVQKAIKKIIEDCSNIREIKAIVKNNNISSNRIFLGLNFNKQRKTNQITIYSWLCR